ncbi:MAG TPA: aminoacyl-tRNA hydrolase [Marinilabiliaceae bacterium]|nr:aminoacyl-tRNA hydrolase [Marinilabiliaceae bacterium]
MFASLVKLFKSKTSKLSTTPPDMKYLITGLGNIGSEYAHTRHNIGFDILDHLAQQEGLTFEASRYGAIAYYKHKGRIFVLLKPSTYVNLSGKAINYWLKKEKIKEENLLVVVDDLAIPFGKLRVKSKGSDAGHNGLKSIQEMLGHNQYARLRFGLGDNFRRGQQVDFVLSRWDDNEKNELDERMDAACEIIKSFGVLGVARTMNLYNKK